MTEAGEVCEQLELSSRQLLAGTSSTRLACARRYKGAAFRRGYNIWQCNRPFHNAAIRQRLAWQLGTLTLNVSTADILGLPARMEATVPPPTMPASTAASPNGIREHEATALPGFGPVIERVVNVVRQTTAIA